MTHKIVGNKIHGLKISEEPLMKLSRWNVLKNMNQVFGQNKFIIEAMFIYGGRRPLVHPGLSRLYFQLEFRKSL